MRTRLDTPERRGNRGFAKLVMQANNQLKFRAYEAEVIDPLKGHTLTELEAYVANLLLDASKEKPLDNESIRIAAGLRFNRVINDRTVKQMIEDLRRDHRFPIIASKGKKKTNERPKQNPGYWWAGSAEELKEWYRRVRGESVKLLQTIERIWDANYPEMVGQLTLGDTEVRGQRSEVRDQRSEIR